MGDAEPESRQQRMLLVFRAEHPLSYETASTRFGSWIPCGPPGDEEVNKKGDHRHPCRPNLRSEGEDGPMTTRLVQGLELELQRANATHRFDREAGEDNDHAHFQHELKQVGY